MPLLLLYGVVQPVKIGEIGNVALQRGNVLADLIDCRIEFALTTAGDKDVCALGNEALRRGETDSAVASRDDGYFSFQFGHDLSPLDFILRATSVPYSIDVAAGEWLQQLRIGRYRRSIKDRYET